MCGLLLRQDENFLKSPWPNGPRMGMVYVIGTTKGIMLFLWLFTHKNLDASLILRL